ncbi:MAG: hypothetical protein K2J99_14595 [Lachnospiraceae bacterium]|nr:hypothetical protein [Lachnospiraceae bacterium]
MKKRGVIKFIIPAVIITIGLFTGCGTAEADSTSVAETEIEKVFLDDSNAGELSDADKKAKYIDYLQKILEGDIEEAYPSVKSAEVILSEDEDAKRAVVSLELQEDLAEDSVSDIAEVVVTAVGDTSMDDIVIQDSEGTILFMQNTPTLAE